jgi:hypothetical protein
MKKLVQLSLTAFTHIEAGQFMQRNLDDVVTANVVPSQDAHVERYLNKLRTEETAFDGCLLQIRKNKETAELLVKDHGRDQSVAFLYRQFMVFEYSDNPTEIVAFKNLKGLFDTHRGVAKMNYEIQTKAVNHLVTELRSAVYTADVTTLNLNLAVNRVANTNTDFDTLYSKRSTEISTAELLDTKTVRATITQTYKEYVAYVLGMAIATDAAFYNTLLEIINGTRKQYSDMLARRKGGTTTKEAEVSLN